MKFFSTALLALLLFSSPAAPDTALRPVTVAGGLEYPWSVAFLPEGGFLVTERGGRLLHITPSGEKTEVAGAPRVHAAGQAGLFDVVLSPDFRESRAVYLSYAGPGPGGSNTELARATLSPDNRRLEDLRVVFRAHPKVGGDNHYGGRFLFAPDGKIFLTLGDRFEYRDHAQNLSDHLGTVVRLNPDGGAPPDNPFRERQDARPEIYSHGHRNAQGIALRPGTAEVWSHEHGPRGGDEVNILKPGANHGWPRATFGREYSGEEITDRPSLPGMEDPLLHWTPSIAPSGMAFYTGDRFPGWRGDLFVGALAGTHLRHLKIKNGKITEQEILLAGLEERIRDVRDGPDGFLYILTDSPDGRLLRLEPGPP